MVQDQDIGFGATLGSTILDTVDMKVTRSDTHFNIRIETEDGSKIRDTQIFHRQVNYEFRNMCMEELIATSKVVVSHLSHPEAKTVLEMIEKYCPIRNTNAPVEMKIVLKNDVPAYQHPRRLSYSDQNFVDEQMREWLKEGIIQPVVLVAKKNGKNRLRCDYRKSNEKIIRDNFSITHMDNVLDKLQNAKIYTTLHLANGVSPCARRSRFKINLNTINVNGGIRKFNQVLKVSSQNRLRINWGKCQILHRTVNFLGYVVQDETITPSKEKIPKRTQR